MAWTKSGLYVTTITDLLTLVALTGGTAATAGTGPFLSLTDKIALHSNALTDGTAPINFSAASPVWANTSEVSGTGWAATGPTFTTLGLTPTFTESPTGSIKYGLTNVSAAGTTLTNVRGCIMYADSLTAPATQVDGMLVAITFGADFSTVAGTFAITWDALGVFAIDLTP